MSSRDSGEISLDGQGHCGNTKGQVRGCSFRGPGFTKSSASTGWPKSGELNACWRSARSVSGVSASLCNASWPRGEWPGSGACGVCPPLPLRDPAASGWPCSAAGPGEWSCAECEPPGQSGRAFAPVFTEGTCRCLGRPSEPAPAGLGVEECPGGDGTAALGQSIPRICCGTRRAPELARRSDETGGDQ